MNLKSKGCVYIGEEANRVEMQELESNRVEIYYDIGKALLTKNSYID